MNTPRRLTNTRRQVAWQWLITGFGEANPTTGETNYSQSGQGSAAYAEAIKFDLRYPGQVFDEETGLNYNLHRSYDPPSGRYFQADPIGLEGGWNRFGYVGGDPLNFIDPEGLAACTVLFPDYPIEYADGKTSTWLGGHGGVLGYDAAGVTQYYEYGRYSPNSPGIVGARLSADDGNIRRVSVPNLVMDKDGQPTSQSVDNLRFALSEKSGKNTRAEITCDAKAEEKKVYDYILSLANN